MRKSIFNFQFSIFNPKGFTLVELIVVFALMAVLSTIGIAGFVNYSRVQSLEASANGLASVLNLAKSRAQSQVNECTSPQVLDGYSVTINIPNNSYKLNVVCSGTSHTVKDFALSRDIIFNPAQTTSTTFFFPVITGGIVGTGRVVLSGYGQVRMIALGSTGIISQSSSLPPPTPIPPTPTPTSVPLRAAVAAFVGVDAVPIPSPTLTLVPTPTSLTPTPTLTYKRVFVTSAKYSANLGGLTGGDAKCQQNANVAGVGGIWKAWLSGNTVSAASRLTHAQVPYKLLDGTLIANNWIDLTDGTLANPIFVDQFNMPVPDFFVWTGASSSGEIVADGNCNSWTGSGDFGITGGSNLTSAGWTIMGGLSCSSTAVALLYCFEQ